MRWWWLLFQEYTVFGYFRQRWVDCRLAGKFNHTVLLKNTAVDHAWTPDTFCSNARQSNLMMRGSGTDSAMTVDIDGAVFFTKRLVKPWPNGVATQWLKFVNAKLCTQACDDMVAAKRKPSRRKLQTRHFSEALRMLTPVKTTESKLCQLSLDSQTVINLCQLGCEFALDQFNAWRRMLWPVVAKRSHKPALVWNLCLLATSIGKGSRPVLLY